MRLWQTCTSECNVLQCCPYSPPPTHTPRSPVWFLLTYSPSLLLEHRPLTTVRQRLLSWASSTPRRCALAFVVSAFVASSFYRVGLFALRLTPNLEVQGSHLSDLYPLTCPLWLSLYGIAPRVIKVHTHHDKEWPRKIAVVFFPNFK